ncbi:MAG: M50 family metallopeptidase, partial [Pseudomonadota bacterium]
DLVRRVNGKEIDDFAELQQIVATSPERQLKVAVERSGDLVTLSVTPILKERYDRIAGKHMRPEIGLQASRDRSLVSHRDVGPLYAVQLGAERTWTIISQTVNYINDIIWQRQRADQVGGIIRIADASGKVAQLGPEYIIQFIAFLSVSIGFINLLPIPLLDGGHLMFYAVEAVRGRPLSDRTQEMSFKVGLALVISLMLFATWNDRVVVKSWFQQPPAENQSQ